MGGVGGVGGQRCWPLPLLRCSAASLAGGRGHGVVVDVFPTDTFHIFCIPP